ncbi:MAG: hypothetical protein PSX37_03395, partial [bacterium]|nr:hypothetical protein [bacterium]
MSKPRRDPAEVVAMIEQGVARGLDLVDSFRIATGKAPRNSTKALAVEHRKTVEANRRRLRKHQVRAKSFQSQVTAGAVMGGVGGALGLLDVVTETASSGGGVPGPAWMWFTAAGIGVLVSWRGRRRLRRLGPVPVVLEPVAPPPALAKGRVGASEVNRFTSVRVQVMNMIPTLD